MATTREGTPQREVLEGQVNKIVGFTPVEIFAVRFTDGQGYVDMCLAFVFGTDKSDGGPGVYVVQPLAVRDTLTIPHKFIKDGIRAKLAQRGPAAPPVTVMDLDMDDLGSAVKE